MVNVCIHKGNDTLGESFIFWPDTTNWWFDMTSRMWSWWCFCSLQISTCRKWTYIRRPFWNLQFSVRFEEPVLSIEVWPDTAFGRIEKICSWDDIAHSNNYTIFCTKTSQRTERSLGRVNRISISSSFHFPVLTRCTGTNPKSCLRTHSTSCFYFVVIRTQTPWRVNLESEAQ